MLFSIMVISVPLNSAVEEHQEGAFWPWAVLGSGLISAVLCGGKLL